MDHGVQLNVHGVVATRYERRQSMIDGYLADTIWTNVTFELEDGSRVRVVAFPHRGLPALAPINGEDS